MTEIFARNLTGDEFAVSAQSTLDNELNGNQILRLTIPPNQVNKRFIDDIDPLWEIDYYGNTYKVVYAKRTTKGHSFYIDVRCVHTALDKLDSIRTYERYDGSLTAISGFNRVFDGTGYDFVLGDTFYAIDIEGLGEGETRLEMFKRLLERYKAEFYISGNTFYLEKYVGRDMSFEYRYRLNASNVQQENDGTAFFTYVRGFGDYDEGEENIVGNAGIKLTYEHPLATVVGRRHAPMVAKGSYKTESAVMDAMKRSVDDSLVVSVSANVKDLRKQGYPFAQPEVGDRVFLVDDRIGYDEEVRVVKIVTERFANGNVKDIEVTFGNQKLGRRYAANLSSAMATLNSLMAGTIQLPFSILDSRAQEMLKKIMSVDTELTLDNGIFAVDKNDPNKVVGLNSAGWFISDDGGATANVIATADGIVADYITAGMLNANNVVVYGEDGDKYMYMTGAQLISHGNFARTWAGVTDTAELNLGIYNGRIMVSNEVTGYNLYMTEKGLSTTMAGATEGTSAGTLEFHSQRFNEVSRGVTLHSTYGTVALVSDESTIVTRSKLTNNIESEDYSVYVRPYMNTRVGLNEFQFYVKDNSSTSETDGALLYGNLTGGATHGSGIRFSKQSDNPKIYATNNNGDIGTGGLHGKYVQAESIRVLDEGANLYLGTSTGEVRVTNNLLYNGGDIGYKPIKASAFNQASSRDYKSNVSELPDIGLDTVMGLKVVSYHLKDDLEEGITDNEQVGLIAEDSAPVATNDLTGIDLYKMSSYSIKAIQELDQRLTKLEEGSSGAELH